ncbi:hypothetical protein M9H77_18752 [Catharanthus roseus]|uniref:Uncharacterized protein n=1 Tax=Catharanthus roseus TaxID=4058 RepID=A0ACC0B8A9_CATRO|nr:hypothetical protein M9H77_18752 [Catharanthus roseus]
MEDIYSFVFGATLENFTTQEGEEEGSQATFVTQVSCSPPLNRLSTLSLLESSRLLVFLLIFRLCRCFSSLGSDVICFSVVHRPSLSPCLSVGEVRELAVRKERERNRGRRLTVIPSRLRPVSEGYNSRSSFSLPSMPQRGSAAAQRLFSSLVT